MRSLLITVALAVTATMLAGCRNKKPEPVPSPQSALVQRTTAARSAHTATIAALGPVAQRLVQGTHRRGAFAWKHAKWTGRIQGNLRETDPMAILSRAAGTPAEGAETT